MLIIGIAGKFCSGKTTLCEMLKNEFQNQIIIINFADKVKAVAEDLFGMTIKDRSLLQKIGAKMREIDEDVWVKYVINQCTEDKIYLIGDVRYPNEVDIIKQNNGVTFYIERNRDLRLIEYQKLYNKQPSLEQETHSSELLDPISCDFVIENNKIIEDALNKIKMKLK